MSLTRSAPTQSPTLASPLVDEDEARAAATATPPRRRRPSGATVVKWVVLLLAMGACLLPILSMLATSFKSPDDILGDAVLPSRLVGSNWREALLETSILTNLRNSLVVALGATLLALAVAVPANFAMARLGAGGRRTMSFIVTAYVAPPVVAVVPLFLLVRSAGLMDSLVGLVLVQGLAVSPVAIWLLDTFFRAVPPEIDEAAAMDGCGPVATLLRVVLPLVMPGVVAVGIICFILTYNDFLLPLMLAQSESTQTLPVGISLLQGGREVMFGQMAAASLAGMVPVYVMAVLLQRWLIGGLTQGAVK